MDITTAVAPGLGQNTRYQQLATALLYWQMLAAKPAPPTFTTVASGGSVANGTYVGGYTWITSQGETDISALLSVTTTGTNISTLTMTPPATFPSGVTQWKCYIGSPLSIQGGANSGASLTLTANPTSGGATPPGSPLAGEYAAYGTIGYLQAAAEGASNIQSAITILTAELSRLANPAGFSGPYFT